MVVLGGFSAKVLRNVDLNNWHVYGEGVREFGWSTIPSAFVYATVPLVYVISGVKLYRATWESYELRRKILLVTVTGLAIFLSVASSPSRKRLAADCAPALILVAWLVYRLGPIRARVGGLLALIAAMVATGGVVRTQRRWSATLDLPVGKAAFTDKERYDEFSYAKARMCCGRYAFGLPPLLFALNLRNPAPIDGFVPFDYTRPEQVIATVDALERYKVRFLMLNKGMFEWPKATAASDHLAPIRDYLARKYRLTITFTNNDELWERIEDCAH